MVLIAVLAALLLPAITGAIRTAKEATVTSDINTLGQALAAFKEKYGEYPPSRIMLSEHGTYFVNDDRARVMVRSGNGASGADITYGELAQRSLTALRKFFPRVQFTVDTGEDPPLIKAGGGKVWYDFNGNGQDDGDADISDGFFGYILEGDECLTFFLGGIPLNTGTFEAPLWSMSGFGKNPLNPFTNNLDNGNSMYSPARLPALFEFKNDRLRDMDDPNGDVVKAGATRFPSYHDSLGTGAPIAYFSAYGGDRYDPNDCNWAPRDSSGVAAGAERDDAGNGPVVRGFRVAFPVGSGTPRPRLAVSVPPNPYHTSPTFRPGITVSTPPLESDFTPTPQWAKGSSFQLLSPGMDGLYGIGGAYLPGASAKMPADMPAVGGTKDTAIRSRENDDLSNFTGGRLD